MLPSTTTCETNETFELKRSRKLNEITRGRELR